MLSKNKKTVSRAAENHLQSTKLRAQREFVSGLTPEQMLAFAPKAKVKKKVKLNMQIYDMNHGTNPADARLVWSNGKAKKTMDKDCKNVVTAGTATWDFY